MKRNDIVKCLIQDRKVLEDYHVKSLALFGSVARNQQTSSSDIDILVSFNHPLGLFAFINLKNHLEDLLGSPVDLVTEQALHPYLRHRILKESVHVI